MPSSDDAGGADDPGDVPTTPDSDATTDEGDGQRETEAYGPTEGPSGREVVVPPRLYKTVTVMSTLLAMVSVVGGFIALDAATNRARASAGEVDPLLALLGLGLIVGGAVAYAFATRFRAAGMGGDDEDDPETGTEAAGEGTRTR